MNQELINYIKEKLLEEKAHLEKELGQFAQRSEHQRDDFQSTFPDYGDKEDDNAVEVADFSTRLSLEGSLENKLQEVNNALKKITEGTYGFCENCQQEIPEERLKVFPSAALCMKCGSEK